MRDLSLRSADALYRSRDTAKVLRSGLNMISQAISIYGDDLKLIVANQVFRSMFDLPAPLCEPGAHFSDTIRHMALAGEYGPVENAEVYVQERVDQALAFEPHYIERERPNGMWISIEGGPLRQGGWVTVYTDITEMRRTEEMLRSKSDELSGRLLDRSEELARTNRALEATITRLHETQRHLEAAEARIRLAAETTPAHIARIDQQERYTYSNHRLPISAANGADDILGHSARDVLGGDIYAIIAPALHSALAGEAKVVEFETPGGGQSIRAAFTPDTNDKDVVTGAYVLSMEIAHAQATVAPIGQIATFGDWTVRFEQLTLEDKTGKTTSLTLAEAALLRLFLTSANRVLTRAEIFEASGVDQGSDRALDVRMSRLRRKLRDDPKSPRLLRTIYGAGYILTAEVEWDA